MQPEFDHRAAPALLTSAALAVHDLASGKLGLEATLVRIAELATRAVDGDLASVTWARPGAPLATIATTDALASNLDGAQYDAGRGPCIEAATVGLAVLVDDLHDAATWPELARAAGTHGVRSSISVPIAADTVIGALNVYGRHPSQFDETSVEIATTFASQAAVAGTLDAARTTADEFARAMQSRSEIEQAKGIIMAATGCDPDTAFDTLVRQSQHENRKLREIAAELVARQHGRIQS